MGERTELRALGSVAGQTGERLLSNRTQSHRRRWIAWAALGCIVLATVLLVLAERYQPLDGGNGLQVENYHFPGMPAGIRPRPVNTFGNLPGELYLPPQRGDMTLSVIMRNNGPLAVTIESVSISPSLPLAGKPRYLEVIRSVNNPLSGVRGPVDGTVLPPGQTIVIGIPVHVPDCVNKATFPYETVSSFQVKERFLAFTHTAAIPIPTPLIWLPGSASPTAGVTCNS